MDHFEILNVRLGSFPRGQWIARSYRLLASRIARGYETAKSRHLFRDFVDATATVEIDERNITIHFQKRAHNPLLVAAAYADRDVRVPWLGGRRLRLIFG